MVSKISLLTLLVLAPSAVSAQISSEGFAEVFTGDGCATLCDDNTVPPTMGPINETGNFDSNTGLIAGYHFATSFSGNKGHHHQTIDLNNNGSDINSAIVIDALTLTRSNTDWTAIVAGGGDGTFTVDSFFDITYTRDLNAQNIRPESTQFNLDFQVSNPDDPFTPPFFFSLTIGSDQNVSSTGLAFVDIEFIDLGLGMTQINGSVSTDPLSIGDGKRRAISTASSFEIFTDGFEPGDTAAWNSGNTISFGLVGVSPGASAQLVPIPPAVWLLGSALGFLVWVQRKTA